jgi:hypothetical protein
MQVMKTQTQQFLGQSRSPYAAGKTRNPAPFEAG